MNEDKCQLLTHGALACLRQLLCQVPDTQTDRHTLTVTLTDRQTATGRQTWVVYVKIVK